MVKKVHTPAFAKQYFTANELSGRDRWMDRIEYETPHRRRKIKPPIEEPPPSQAKKIIVGVSLIRRTKSSN